MCFIMYSFFLWAVITAISSGAAVVVRDCGDLVIYKDFLWHVVFYCNEYSFRLGPPSLSGCVKCYLQDTTISHS